MRPLLDRSAVAPLDLADQTPRACVLIMEGSERIAPMAYYVDGMEITPQAIQGMANPDGHPRSVARSPIIMFSPLIPWVLIRREDMTLETRRSLLVSQIEDQKAGEALVKEVQGESQEKASPPPPPAPPEWPSGQYL